MPEETAKMQTANSKQPNYCPLISIVLIVYNCEKYINDCLDSLCKQDYHERNYEIIITDDGSTDTSGKICDEYAAEYPFIHVTHTKNCGESHARNVGLQQCRGKYIAFCDGDDEVSPQLVSVLTQALEIHKKPDIIFYRYLMDLPKNMWPVYDVNNMKESAAEYIDAEELAIRAASFAGGYIWNKLFKRELAKSVRFDEDVKASEDHYWLMNVLASHPNIKVCCIDYCLYHYVQHPNIGQTRSISRIYDTNGMKRSILSYEKGLAIKGLPRRTAEQIRGRIYEQSLNTLFSRQVYMNNEVYMKLKKFMKEYARDYYFKYHCSSRNKIKMLIKHILMIFHIHK